MNRVTLGDCLQDHLAEVRRRIYDHEIEHLAEQAEDPDHVWRGYLVRIRGSRRRGKHPDIAFLVVHKEGFQQALVK
jgi:hypothetical protein